MLYKARIIARIDQSANPVNFMTPALQADSVDSFLESKEMKALYNLLIDLDVEVIAIEVLEKKNKIQPNSNETLPLHAVLN